MSRRMRQQIPWSTHGSPRRNDPERLLDAGHALMTESAEDERLAQLARKVDPRARLVRTWRLTGGVSARVTALETERPDGLTRKMIVRQRGDVDLQRTRRLQRTSSDSWTCCSRRGYRHRSRTIWIDPARSLPLRIWPLKIPPALRQCSCVER